jgi:hypothetical protein
MPLLVSGSTVDIASGLVGYCDAAVEDAIPTSSVAVILSTVEAVSTAIVVASSGSVPREVVADTVSSETDGSVVTNVICDISLVLPAVVLWTIDGAVVDVTSSVIVMSTDATSAADVEDTMTTWLVVEPASATTSVLVEATSVENVSVEITSLVEGGGATMIELVLRLSVV